MSVVNMVVGAPTEDGATFVAKVDGGGPVRVAVATGPGMGDPVFTSSQAVDADGVAKVAITGLASSTRHWWQVEDNGVLDTAVTGQLRTLPPAGSQASFTVGFAACAGASPTFPGVAGGELDPNRVSNHPVFGDIRTKALAEDWPLFVQLGDWGYPDYGDATVDTLANRRHYVDDNLAQPNQGPLWREVPMAHIWDDHDFAGNNSDGSYVDKANAAAVYRERVPHYPLPDAGAIYQAPDPIGRVQLILSDARFYRSPNADPDGPGKTMLGAAQKAWLDDLLANTTAEFVVWVQPGQWLNTGDDTWGNFPTARDEVAGIFTDRGFTSRMCQIGGDRHSAGIDSGGSNDAGGFPILHAASLDSSHGGGATDLFDVLDDTPGRGQFGTVTITDLGHTIVVRLAAWRGTTELGSYQFAVAVAGTPPSAGVTSVQEFAPILSGSHTPVFEARVLTSFQTGFDPAGVDLPIIDGDVQFDATAEVFATLGLTTQGTDPATGRSWFPRLPGDLLAPYGNEVFVRRGIDLGGGGILWSPLGIFRLETAEQGGDVEDPIGLGGSDRMAAVIESQLIAPREFAETTPVASFVAALIGEVYPDATVIFDDDSGLADIGRQIVVDDSRYEPLLEVVDGLGKVMFWDGEGFLRIEDPPDETVPVWTVNAGRNGVLVEASRRVSRIGAPNGVLVIGEGGSDQNPVRGAAIDDGPRSPTRWGGPYGKVLDKEQLTTVTTITQAEQAAREILRRRLGVPHSADFGAIVNPALRPRHPVLVVHRDGNRDRHIMQTVTVPLTAAGTMSGTTRERTTVVIANVIA